MDIVKFLFFSSLEYLSILYMLSVLFRLSFKENLPPFIFIAIILNLVSYFSRFSAQIGSYAVFLQVILLISCIVLIMRIHWFYAASMALIPSIGFLVVQGIIFYILDSFSLFNLADDVGADGTITFWAYMLQLFTATIYTMLALIAKYLNYGWSFVPQRTKQINLKQRDNKLMLLGMIMSVVFLLVMRYAGLSGGVYLLINCVGMLLCYILLFWVFHKKEQRFEF
ncbi:hypothetical protein A616_17555 [Brevibacillus brevis X23]|nr:hypothetical protein A616_17555 [Brevibacillus brevis X23]